MDTESLWQAIAAYGNARWRGYSHEIDAADHLSEIKEILNRSETETRELLAENERLVDEVNEARKETSEQARLNGMGAEREARLMAEVSELKAKLTEKAYLLRGCYAADHKQKQRIEELTAELEAECEETKRWLVKAQNERDARKELEAELERIKQSWDEWIKKTEWVQETYQPKELGRHRADVLRMRIEALQAELERIKALEPIGFVSQANMKFLSESAAKDWIPIWNTPTQDPWDSPTKASKIPLYALGSKTDE